MLHSREFYNTHTFIAHGYPGTKYSVLLAKRLPHMGIYVLCTWYFKLLRVLRKQTFAAHGYLYTLYLVLYTPTGPAKEDVCRTWVSMYFVLGTLYSFGSCESKRLPHMGIYVLCTWYFIVFQVLRKQTFVAHGYLCTLYLVLSTLSTQRCFSYCCYHLPFGQPSVPPPRLYSTLLFFPIH